MRVSRVAKMNRTMPGDELLRDADTATRAVSIATSPSALAPHGPRL